ncbi:glycosyltransferase [Aliarcobacter skirrowii]|uniref:glycosyltransferase n=1 Tax=Aliarcobacter skirrowii TaxID=28200 RepID=UPI0029C0DF03|nr:glycosyltransferase [Aliarcobacter skirrowii]
MIQSSKNIEVSHMKSSIEKIKLFSKKIDNALYFGNLPPLVKSKNSVVYFHNLYLLMPFQKLIRTSAKFFVKYFLQQLYIRFFIKNVDIVACQNDEIKKQFIKKFNFKNIWLLPFFRLCDKELLEKSEKIYDFCYVSLAYPHKNHQRLLEACQILSDEKVHFSLALTIEEGHDDLIEKIKLINKKGNIKISNLGKISKEEVCKLYAQSRCLVFPSTKETFDLGLVEAVNMDLDVIASDLDYVYQSIEPSLVFDPISSLDISLKMKEYLKEQTKHSKVKIENKINDLIQILIEKASNV